MTREQLTEKIAELTWNVAYAQQRAEHYEVRSKEWRECEQTNRYQINRLTRELEEMTAKGDGHA